MNKGCFSWKRRLGVASLFLRTFSRQRPAQTPPAATAASQKGHEGHEPVPANRDLRLLQRKQVRRLLREIGDESARQATAEFWYDTSKVSLSEEEVRQAHENLAGFFRILQEWDTREQGDA